MSKLSQRLTYTFYLLTALTSFSHADSAARSWTLSELDTLSGREWLWIDAKYQDPISEFYTKTEGPDKRPEPKQYVIPTYPEIAKIAGAEGSVWLKVLIDEKGKMRVARILKDSGLDVGFEDAAMKAAKGSTWKPAIKDGKRVPIWVTYEAPFYLETTMDGQPIKIINQWHWAVRNAAPSLSDSFIGDEPSDLDRPGVDAFVNVEGRPEKVKDGFLRYPESARKSGLEGSVWVKILVNRSGDVAEAMVAKASDCDCGFEDAALWSAIHSQWQPATMDGQPIALWVTYEVVFRMMN